ncbi:signal peptidase I [Actinoplanes sp. NPDC051861]|uniref:signal peptidase I n=1 Tax=Actinoplanes sp. NPDC051861 TaxID=3155170 RepID=UPI003424FBF5
MTAEVEPVARGGRGRRVRRWGVGLVVLVVLVAALWVWVVGPVRVPSTAMEPTVVAGSTVLVVKVGGVERGDVVLVGAVSGGRLLRVIGLGGDRISCAGGRVSRDGAVIEESYVASGSATECAAVTVPDGEVYLLGDNREAAKDSRHEGPWPLGDVSGRMISRLWSDDPRQGN